METLYALGGSATAAAWMKACLWKTTVFDFERTVIAPLTLDRHIHERSELRILTDGGMVRIGQMEAPVVPAGVVAGQRYVAPVRALSARHVVRVRPLREGSLDYRNIPSRFGDQRVAHSAKAVVADA
jgi:hypothetical protein